MKREDSQIINQSTHSKTLSAKHKITENAFKGRGSQSLAIAILPTSSFND